MDPYCIILESKILRINTNKQCLGSNVSFLPNLDFLATSSKWTKGGISLNALPHSLDISTQSPWGESLQCSVKEGVLYVWDRLGKDMDKSGTTVGWQCSILPKQSEICQVESSLVLFICQRALQTSLGFVTYINGKMPVLLSVATTFDCNSSQEIV